jgi:hypothetical protein
MPESLFPFVEQEIQETTIKNELPIPHEYAWDFANNDFIMENGRPKIVQENEAIKIWIYKAIKTYRNRHVIYSDAYGCEIESLIGNEMSSEAKKQLFKQYIEECLYVNPYVINIYNFEVNIDSDQLHANFIVTTPYGEIEVSI